uniref:Enoyl-CoA delta isomerase 2, mitochondrial n=1 Tax=Cacopsylla melanoneura TaxID=428564 RepID=A0A8D8TZM1_9HEMI
MSSKHLLVTYEGSIQKILFNRPEKKNAISYDIYKKLPHILQSGASNPNVTLTVLTGAGNYFSSGMDLSNDIEELADVEGETHIKKSSFILQKYVAAFIDYPKPLLAIVNGPAIGISCTTLALCDTVYASDTATFHTPFTALGMTPEGCSSVTFPVIFGSSVASEVMYMGRKLSARDALQYGLVSGVYSAAQLESEVWPKLRQMAKLPPKGLIFAKRLVREPLLKILHDANKSECDRLEERWESDEFANAMNEFFKKESRRSNL